MFKYRVTNTSGERDNGARARPIFLTEAGRLLQPGDAAPINRLDKGTSDLVDVGDLKIEEGGFPAYVPPKKPKPVVKDDEDDDYSTKRAAPSNEKAGFRDVKKGKSKNIIALPAAGAEEDQAEDQEVMSASTDDDDDLGIPSVTKADVANRTGLEDLDDSKPTQSSAASGFNDNILKKD